MRIYKLFMLLIYFISFSLNVSFAFADLTAEEVLSAADRHRGSSDGVEWIIDLHSIDKNKEQKRTLNIKSKGLKALINFISPSKVKGRKLLMLDRNMWFIKPGLKKAVPISQRQKLLGNASNGDIASTNYSGDYDVVSMTEDVISERPCYLLQLKGKNKKVTYDTIKYWIAKEDLLGIQAEFYTVSGKMFKSAIFEYDNTVTIDGTPEQFISKMIISSNLMKDNVTTMTYRDIKIKNISDSTFNMNLLMR